MYHQSTTRLTEDLGEGGFGHRVPASGHHTDDPSRRSGLSRDPDESMCDLCPATIGHWTPRSQGDQPLRDALGAPFLRATSDGKGDREDRVPADRRGHLHSRGYRSLSRLRNQTKHRVAAHLSRHRVVRRVGGGVEVGCRHPYKAHILSEHRHRVGWANLHHTIGM